MNVLVRDEVEASFLLCSSKLISEFGLLNRSSTESGLSFPCGVVFNKNIFKNVLGVSKSFLELVLLLLLILVNTVEFD